MLILKNYKNKNKKILNSQYLMSILFFGGWLSPFSFMPDGVFWMLSKMLLIFVKNGIKPRLILITKACL